MLDLLSGWLSIHLKYTHIPTAEQYIRSLDTARDWALSLGSLAKEKRVTFLSRYAEMQEKFGNESKACIHISAALKIDPGNEKLRQELRRLRSALPNEVSDFLRNTPSIFSDPIPTLRTSDRRPLEEDLCSICLTTLNSTKKRAEISTCKHIFHEKCISKWIQNSSGTCPLCREDL
jgi:hypothetical protein